MIFKTSLFKSNKLNFIIQYRNYFYLNEDHNKYNQYFNKNVWKIKIYYRNLKNGLKKYLIHSIYTRNGFLPNRSLKSFC